MKRLLILFFIAQGLITVVVAQPTPWQDTLSTIDRIFAAWQSTAAPGGVLRVSRGGELLVEKAYGMADLERNVINTPATVFESGSVAKQFTAAAALLLVREGKLGLDDNLCQHFPDFPDYGSSVTVEQLLHHTSGLRDWGVVAAIGGWPRGSRAYTPAHVREIIWRQKRLNHEPGERYIYSNSNYNMLGFLVEKVSGMSLQDFTETHLFKPAGMTHTQWRDNYNEIVPGRAIAYGRDNGVFVQNMPFENTFGHGAMLTTVEDLEKWNLRWKTGVLGGEVNDLQRQKGKLNNGKEVSYARGVVIGNVNGVTQISHSGATAGYRAWLAYYPEKDLSVALLSNDGTCAPEQLGVQVAEVFFGKKETKTPDFPEVAAATEVLIEKTGFYVNKTNYDTLNAVLREGKLWLNPRGAFTYIGDNKFQHGGHIVTIASPNQLTWKNPDGNTQTFDKITPYRPNAEELAVFAGAYFSDEAEVKIALRVDKDRLLFFRAPDFSTPLTPVYPDVFKDEEGNTYVFSRHSKNKISGFAFSTGRVLELWFGRM